MTDLRCKRCGCPHVRWMQTNAGKWYLAVKPDLETADAEARAYARAARKRPHLCGQSCTAAEKYQIDREIAEADAYQAALEEADGGWDADAAYERYLEDGGPHALAIAAEDDCERELEAQDAGLQEMRAARERWTCAVDGCEIGGVGAHQDAYERVQAGYGRLAADRFADLHHDLNAGDEARRLAIREDRAFLENWSEAEKRYAWGDR